MTHLRGVRLPTVLALVAAVAAGCLPAGALPLGTPTLELRVASAAGEALAFVPGALRAPARTYVRITFQNGSSQQHNLTFQTPISVGSNTIVEAGASDGVELVTPGPGTYAFVCTIHVDMSGTLTVE